MVIFLSNKGSKQRIEVQTAPTWLPKKFSARKKDIVIRFQTDDGERRLFRKKKKLLPSEWAPKYRKITYGPLKGAYYDPDFMPHMAGIMDAASEPFVREITNCKAPQTGGSANWETFIGNRADVSPGDTLIVYPDRDTARKRCQDYLQPMFTDSPRLRSLLTGVDDDMASMRVKLQTMLIYMAWAGSVTSIGNVSVRFLIVDELDKCPSHPSKKEASFETLVAERTAAYDRFGSLKVWNSTPTMAPSPIARKLGDMDIICDYQVTCPECGGLQIMDFDHVDFAGERDHKKMERDKLARYRCEHCASLWDDRSRDHAVCLGKWVVRGDGRELKEVLRSDRPEKIGFHSPAWISPLNSLSKCAAAFLRALRDHSEMIYFDTQIKAEEHVPYERVRSEEAILSLRDDRPEGVVPSGGVVATLVAGSDTQDDGHYYWIDAVGYGLEQERWRIRAGFVETEAALMRAVFGAEYKDVDGNVYPVRLMVKDAMGHRTGEVYDMCLRSQGRIIPYKGASGRRPSPYTVTKVDRYPGSSTPFPGGVSLYTCDSHYYKDRVSAKLSIKPDDAGAWHMEKDMTEEQASHMCSEYRDEQNMWQCPSNRPNHYWDSAVMSLIASDILQIKFLAKPTEEAHVKPVKKQKTVNPYTGGRQLFSGR